MKSSLLMFLQKKKTIPEWKTRKTRIFWLKFTRRLFITTRAALCELKILKNRRNGVNGEIQIAMKKIDKLE